MRMPWIRGSIPAPAGEPQALPNRPRRPPVYPRACGEPPQMPCERSVARVYPRACGGTPSRSTACCISLGLSPRLRGNLLIPSAINAVSRSIPAPAGEPPTARTTWATWRLYPRACGGTANAKPSPASSNGLSPRLRGNHDDGDRRESYSRSIPAPAGEPGTDLRGRSLTRVYPRACGGTLPEVHCVCGLPGSIPAPAGEPFQLFDAERIVGVYPRACGGTQLPPRIRVVAAGLSPRLRGNHEPALLNHVPDRSIPRLRGTAAPRMSRLIAQGLSPRLRGNPLPPTRCPPSARSIPAPAGGTASRHSNVPFTSGLSPRLRGNHDLIPEPFVKFGSIPAPAGEPSLPYSCRLRVGVYPRACGGTAGL